MPTATVEPKLSPAVTKFIAHPRKMLIDGKWVNAASGKTFETFNPATGEALARVAEGDKADVDAAVRAARKAFEGGPWRRITPAERTRMLFKLADLIDAHTDELAQLDTLNNGMPLAAARGSCGFAAEILRYNAGWATKFTGETTPHSIPTGEDEHWFTYSLREHKPGDKVTVIVLRNGERISREVTLEVRK